MVRNLFGVLTIAAILAVPSLVIAHEGHQVMGTVSTVEGNNVMVKATDGKTWMVMVDAKTKITRGKQKLTVSALKAGDRIVAEGKDDKNMLTATSVQVGVAAGKASTAKESATHADHDAKH